MGYILPDLNLLKVTKDVKQDGQLGEFVIEPLSPGYGVTVGNTLRRILLSSLEGAAVSSVKIASASHEFSTIKGIKEDVVELILNLKTARFKLNADSNATLELSVKGPKVVTTADFKKSADVEPVDTDHYIATVEKGGKLDFEVEINKGRGYMPVEKRSDEKVPVGTILVDSIYTPVKKVRYDIVNTRVGSVTNYDKLVIELTTDGSITAEAALDMAAKIMSEHLAVISEACQIKEKVVKTKKTASKKTTKKKNDEKS